MNTINIDHAGGTGQIKLISTKTHQDHVYVYTGQNYGCCESSALHALNELSRHNFLKLHQRQITNRDVRILLPQTNDLNSSSQKRRSNLRSFQYENDELIFNHNSNDDFVDDDYGDGEGNGYNSCGFTASSGLHSTRLIENKNYQTFITNFNKIAIACYLKLLKTNQNIWSSYGIDDQQLIDDTNFYVLNSPNENNNISNKSINEKSLQRNLLDESFIRQYVDLIVLVHNQIVNKLHQLLNFHPLRVHFNSNTNTNNNNNNNNNNKKSSGCHLFRSFRILGLRQDKRRSQCYTSNNHNQVHFCNYTMNHDHKSSNLNNSSSLTSSSSSNVKIINNPTKPSYSNINQTNFDPSNNFIIKNNFNEIIDIRGAFDVKQFQNKMGYDVFIECEMNYYNVLSDRITSYYNNNSKNGHHFNINNQNNIFSGISPRSSQMNQKNNSCQYSNKIKSDYKYFKVIDDPSHYNSNRNNSSYTASQNNHHFEPNKNNENGFYNQISGNNISNMRYGNEPQIRSATSRRHYGQHFNEQNNDNQSEYKFLNINLMNHNNFAYKFTDDDLKNVLTNINQNYRFKSSNNFSSYSNNNSNLNEQIRQNGFKYNR